MTYTVENMGRVEISPALPSAMIDYLTCFHTSRRMDREKGPYYTGGWNDFSQETADDVRNYNKIAEGQPALWCNWAPTSDGTALVWVNVDDTHTAAEKLLQAEAWLLYIVEHFLQGHTCTRVAAASIPGKISGAVYG